MIVKVRSASYFLFSILILKKTSLVLMKFRKLGKCYPVTPGKQINISIGESSCLRLLIVTVIFSITESPPLSYSDRVTFFYIWMSNWEIMLLYLLKSRTMRNVNLTNVKSHFEVRTRYLYYELCHPSYLSHLEKENWDFFRD